MDTAVTLALAEVESSTLELLSALVRRPSLGPAAAATREALDVLAEFLRSAEIDVEISESATGVPTLVARLDSGSSGANLLLQGTWTSYRSTPVGSATLSARCSRTVSSTAAVHAT